MTPLLELDDVWMTFAGRRGRSVTACRGVSLSVGDGEVVGLVGESGSGKSTVANLALGLLAPSGGEAAFRGEPVTARGRRAERELRTRMQAVFQDPLLALDARRTVAWAVAEPLRIHGRGSRAEQRARVDELLASVGLDAELADRRPAHLSGGQLQRVNIARAIALGPSLLVCDEPVSALDVSVQAQILNLFLDIQQRLGMAMLFISHDLAVVRHVADRLVVMYAGRVVEEGPAEAVCDEPHHPYTRALLEACLEPEPGGGRSAAAAADRAEGVPDRGCPFVPRCPLAQPACAAEDPPLREVVQDRRTACRRAELLVAARTH